MHELDDLLPENDMRVVHRLRAGQGDARRDAAGGEGVECVQAGLLGSPVRNELIDDGSS